MEKNTPTGYETRDINSLITKRQQFIFNKYPVYRIITLLQMVVQARWDTDSVFLTLPHIESHMIYLFSQLQASCVPELIHNLEGKYEKLAAVLRSELDEQEIEDVWSVLNRMPLLEARLTVQNQPIPRNSRRLADKDWIAVKTGSQVSINVNLRRLNRPGREGTKVYAPKYPKPKDEGWLLVVGEVESRELLALKRVGSVLRGTKQSLVISPTKPGRHIYTLYVMSDGYLGIDQQYDIPLQVEGDEGEIFYSDEEEMPELRPVRGVEASTQEQQEYNITANHVTYSDWNDDDNAASWE